MTGLEFNQWQISVHFGGVSIDLLHQVSAGTSLKQTKNAGFNHLSKY